LLAAQPGWVERSETHRDKLYDLVAWRWVSLTLNPSLSYELRAALNPFCNVELAQAGTGKLAQKNCAPAIAFR